MPVANDFSGRLLRQGEAMWHSQDEAQADVPCVSEFVSSDRMHADRRILRLGHEQSILTPS